MGRYQDNEQIKTQLDKLRQKVGLIAFASIGGSHAWNMDAPNSDIDVRCIHLMQPRDYALASLHKEYPKTFEWVEDNVDIASYEVGFAVSKMLAGNTGFLEMLQTYTFLPEFRELEYVLDSIAEMPVNLMQLYNHYTGVAIGNYNRYVAGHTEIHESRYYHIVKGIICADLIRLGVSCFPIDLIFFFNRYQEELQCTTEEYEAIDDLLRRKKAGQLKIAGRNLPIDDYIIKISQAKYLQESRLDEQGRRLRDDKIAHVKELYANMIISYIGESK